MPSDDALDVWYFAHMLDVDADPTFARDGVEREPLRMSDIEHEVSDPHFSTQARFPLRAVAKAQVLGRNGCIPGQDQS